MTRLRWPVWVAPILGALWMAFLFGVLVLLASWSG